MRRRSGPGRVKLVQVLDGDGPPPVPAGQAWGEVGVCEICLHVRNVQEVHDALVAAGCASLMEPMSAEVPPSGVSLDIAYVADPWGTKLEMIEWTGLWRSLPGPRTRRGCQPRRLRRHRHGSHARFLRAARVSRSCSSSRWSSSIRWRRGTRRLGTTRQALPAQHMTMPMPAQGAAIEPVVLDPPGHDCRGEWGHLGPMDFGIRVGNIDTAAARLRDWGVAVHGEPQSARRRLRRVALRRTSPSRTETTSRSSRRAIDPAREQPGRSGARPPCPRAPT